eukprot:3155603-Prymnesium_polylepis.1
MKLLRRQSCVSRRMLRAQCRCAPRAEEAKIFAGPRDGVPLTGMWRYVPSNTVKGRTLRLRCRTGRYPGLLAAR